MIKVDNISAWGFDHAVRGMRNPYDSWSRSDSYYIDDSFNEFKIGQADLTLMKSLYKAGPEHRKYLRQIFVSMDITAPFYWWKEFDKYQIGVTTNSCSTMHTLTKKEFALEDFSYDNNDAFFVDLLIHLNSLRDEYLETKDKAIWRKLIQLLPMGYNQKRTVTMNYENVISMIKQRKGHKLSEWNSFIETLLELPYVSELINE